MLETEPFLDRAFWQRDQEPALENEVGDDGHAERHAQDNGPAVFAEPSHEPADEDDRCDIEAGERHGTDIDRGGNDHAHDLTKLSPLRKQPVILLVQSVPQADRAGSDDENSDIEWKKSGARAFGAPVDSGLDAADDHDRAEGGDQQRDAGFHRLVRWAGMVMATRGHGNSPRNRILKIRNRPVLVLARIRPSAFFKS